MTNREAHEQAAGMGLCDEFFSFNKIDPNAEYSQGTKLLTRYNAVPKIIGQDMNVEYEADPNGQLVFADGAITRVRELEEALTEALKLVLGNYTRSSMAAGYWPDVKPIVERIDAALKGREQ